MTTVPKFEPCYIPSSTQTVEVTHNGTPVTYTVPDAGVRSQSELMDLWATDIEDDLGVGSWTGSVLYASQRCRLVWDTIYTIDIDWTNALEMRDYLGYTGTTVSGEGPYTYTASNAPDGIWYPACPLQKVDLSAGMALQVHRFAADTAHSASTQQYSVSRAEVTALIDNTALDEAEWLQFYDFWANHALSGSFSYFQGYTDTYPNALVCSLPVKARRLKRKRPYTTRRYYQVEFDVVIRNGGLL